MNLNFLDDRIYRLETPVKIVLKRYKDGSLAILLAYDAKGSGDDNLWASATLYRGIPLEDTDTVFIKDDEENMGMIDLLVKHGIIEKTPVWDDNNGCPMCRLTPEFMDYVSSFKSASEITPQPSV